MISEWRWMGTMRLIGRRARRPGLRCCDWRRMESDAQEFNLSCHPISPAKGSGGPQRNSKMDASTEIRQRADLRDYLAAERTFLAWIRTGLALMGFGFVVARFGLFLQQLLLIGHAPSAPSYGVSLWFGTALIAVGVAVNLSSAWRHVRLVRELDQGEPECSRSLTPAVATALFLALVGLAMAVHLVSVRGTANLQSTNSEEVSMALASSKEALAGSKGIIDKPSNHSVEQTVEKLKNILQSKGVTLFALVDHS